MTMYLCKIHITPFPEVFVLHLPISNSCWAWYTYGSDFRHFDEPPYTLLNALTSLCTFQSQILSGQIQQKFFC